MLRLYLPTPSMGPKGGRGYRRGCTTVVVAGFLVSFSTATRQSYEIGFLLIDVWRLNSGLESNRGEVE